MNQRLLRHVMHHLVHDPLSNAPAVKFTFLNPLTLSLLSTFTDLFFLTLAYESCSVQSKLGASYP